MTSTPDLNALALEAACCAFDPSDWGAMGHNDCPVCDSYRKHTRGKMTAAITAYLSALTAATPTGEEDGDYVSPPLRNMRTLQPSPPVPPMEERKK